MRGGQVFGGCMTGGQVSSGQVICVVLNTNN